MFLFQIVRFLRFSGQRHEDALGFEREIEAAAAGSLYCLRGTCHYQPLYRSGLLFR